MPWFDAVVTRAKAMGACLVVQRGPHGPFRCETHGEEVEVDDYRAPERCERGEE